MIGCIYHEADLDGVMSAAIVKKSISKGTLIFFLTITARKYLT
jgi:hypothetical protein